MSGKYDAGRDGFGAGNISWTRDRIMARLVSAAYQFDPSHTDLARIEGFVGPAAEVTGRSLSRGWAKANTIVFSQVRGSPVAGMIVWSEAGSTLIFHHDQIDNFPMKTNGGDIHVDIPEKGLLRI